MNQNVMNGHCSYGAGPSTTRTTPRKGSTTATVAVMTRPMRVNIHWQLHCWVLTSTSTAILAIVGL